MLRKPGTWNVSYDDTSNVAVIDIEDRHNHKKPIPMPINTNGITSDGVYRVICGCRPGIGAWNPQGPVPGTVVFIDAGTDEIEKTIELDGEGGRPCY